MSPINYQSLLPLYGHWEIENDGKMATFTDRAGEQSSHGFALLNRSVDDGVIECSITLPDPNPDCGAFLVFRANGQDSYYAGGVGGWDSAYVLLEGRHLSPTRLASAGNINNLQPNRKYRIKLALEGQRAQMFVDGVKVIDYDRLGSGSGVGVGLLTFKSSKHVTFEEMSIDDARPNAFVAMPFSEPYDEVYRDAIEPIIAEIGYEPLRVDDSSQPGIVLNDVWRYITEASIVIAEISEQNANVYYELGAAHALNKPTVLLAKKGTSLPFDVKPYRCIFYENTIPGRAKLQNALLSSLGAALGITAKGREPN